MYNAVVIWPQPDIETTVDAFFWCEDTFGEQGNKWDWALSSEDDRHSIYFIDLATANWFVLTWGNNDTETLS